MTYKAFWQPMTKCYDEGEARAIAQMVMELKFGLSMADVLAGKTPPEEELLALQRRLLDGEPVQYALGMAEFCGNVFAVGPGVLIPRPETQLLCEWILAEHSNVSHLLDIGTGSGCIACTLAKGLPEADVEAWDISPDALAIAEENANRTHVLVSFRLQDALAPPSSDRSRWDIIVSNPPYVCDSERADMAPHVLNHEPSLALFVPDADPLRFYRSIGSYAAKALTTEGALYFEINPRHADALRTMLHEMGFAHVETREDQFGKTRFIKACK